MGTAACLKVYVLDVLPQRHPRGAVNDLYPYRRLALGLEHIVDQVFGCEVDVTAPMWIVLAQDALRVQASQAPVRQITLAGNWVSDCICTNAHVPIHMYGTI